MFLDEREVVLFVSLVHFERMVTWWLSLLVRHLKRNDDCG
jgi:hypothetical protein